MEARQSEVVIADATATRPLTMRPFAQGELRVTRAAITVGGQSVVARSEIRSANVWSSAKFGTVVLVRRKLLRRGVDLRVKDLADARTLVRALGLDPTQTANEMTVAGLSPMHMVQRLAFFLSLIAIAVVGGLGGVAALHAAAGMGLGVAAACVVPLAVLTYAVGLAAMVTPVRVTIGADGIFLRWLWRRRFIPLAEVVSAEVVGPKGAAPSPHRSIYARLKLRSGEVLDLCVAFRSRGVVDESRRDVMQMRGEMLVEKIREAMEAQRGGDVPWSASALSRGDRSLVDWLAWLRDVRARVATFRDGVELARDELWRIVEDPRANAEHRAAAAVALAPDLDEEGKAKLRVAAQAAAAPKLRVALEATADADDDRLRDALAEIAPSHEATKD